ncbi:MAG: hypothetical protein H5U33_13585, partial [Pseudomonas sp.]|nr:hypothetical protein [Pseudomonas sp.]
MNLPLSLNLLAFLALLLGLAQTRRTAWSLAKKVLLGLPRAVREIALDDEPPL